LSCRRALKTRRQCANLAGEDIPAGSIPALKAGPAVAAAGQSRWAAAFGPDPCRGAQTHPRRRVSRPANELVSPGSAAAPAAQLFDSNRFMLMAMFSRLGL